VTSVSDVSGAARDSIGRYFSLVSALPSVLLVCYGFVLVASGSWSGRPDPRQAVNTTLHLGVTGFLILIMLSIALALVLHPLQFAMVQLLEGYWGVSKLAEYARGIRMAHHWGRYARLVYKQYLGETELEQRGEYTGDESYHELLTRMILRSRSDETDRLLREQPTVPEEAMPTRLGTVLRFYESSAAKPYGLSAIQVMPYLARVASAEDMAYVNDQRSQLDLAVRMCVTALLACVLTVTLLWQDGLWLLVTLLPYSIAYVSYRGAIVAARQYGRAVAVVIALNRFTLYERLRLPLPATAAAERRAATDLEKLMGHEQTYTATYQHPSSHPE
jgi:hypothetical protein